MDSVNPFVVFEVKLDKDRGILILTIRKEENDNVCFFRLHHQSINCHPEKVQQIIRSQKITARTKSIKVNIYSFFTHYWNEELGCFEFKGVKLNSTGQETLKLENIKINKEVGLLKRRKAREVSTKEEKEKEKLEKLKEKHIEQEKEFQLRRAKRIAEVKADIESKMIKDADMK